MEQTEEGFRPKIQAYEQLQGLFGNSTEDDESDLMTIDQREALRELDDLQSAGPPPPVPAVDATVVSGGGDGEVSNMVDVEVKTASVAKVVEMSTVKRKRGRPPRIQGKAGPTPPPAKKITPMDDEEDVCFICFDGGSLVLCDRRGCPKAYHPSCIKRDEAFFRSKAKWNCGWHICSSCQKASHYMCYTCTYSLCKRCTKDADFVCLRENKGLCGTCLRTIMLIENITPGNTPMVQVDFDDKTSWEYLFKIYWICLKDKLSISVDELIEAKNPWKGDELSKAKRSWKTFGSTIGSKEVGVGYHGNGGQSSCLGNCYGNVVGNHFNRRITNDQSEVLNEHNSLAKEKSVVDIITPLPQGTAWATKELLEFVSYMKNGDTSMISQFDVEGLLLEYVKRNNLRDPCQKSQIICDSRLMNLFRRSYVGHFEMRSLLEYHFLIKEQSPTNDSAKVGVSAAIGGQAGPAGSNGSQMIVSNDRCKEHKLIDKRGVQINLNSTEYAAIDVHNINLLYLKQSSMENLMEDADKFREKVVGSFVRVRIPGGDQKQGMHRLVLVVGTTKVAESYKVGSRTTNFMLEILNLDKTEMVTISGISDQEFSEDECRHLRQSMKCGFFKRLKMAEIQEKALALQPVKVSESLEAEISQLNRRCDQAKEKGDRKELRECTEKLDLLKSPMERQRRLLQFPTVHMDLNMDPSYGSDEAVGDSADVKQGDHIKPEISDSGRNDLELNSPLKVGDMNDVGIKEHGTLFADTHGTKVHDQGVGAFGLNNENLSKNQLKPTTMRTCDWNGQSIHSESHAGVASASSPSLNSSGIDLSYNGFETEKLWHYQDPYGNVHGPFAIMQLRQWSATGSFPPELRVWRRDKKQDDSILLVDALAGQFSKRLLQQPQKTIASNDVDNKLGQGFTCSTDATTDQNSLHNDGSVKVNINDANELMRSNGTITHTIPWIKAIDDKIANDTSNSLTHMVDKNSQKTKKSRTNTRGHDEKGANIEGHTSQSSVENWKSEPLDGSSSRWDSNTDFLSMARPNAKSEHDQKILVPDLQNHGQSKVEADIKLSVSSNASGQVSGPNWSTTSSLVVGQLPDVAGKWGAYSAPVKPSVVEVWDSNVVSASSLNPSEWANVQTATGTQKLISTSPSHRAIDTSSWQPLVPNEFCSLADESVSDLLAEVEAMESLGGLPSPTSKLSCGGELTLGSDNDCFSPVEPFSPALDPGKSDALSSTGDVQMPSQLTAASVLLRLSLMPSQPTTADESLTVSRRTSELNVIDATDKHHQLSRVPPPSIVPDEPLQASQTPFRLWQTGALDSQKSFSGHSSSAEVEGGKKPSDVSVNQWNTRSEVPVASSTVDPGGPGSDIQASSSSTVSQVEAGSDNQHPVSSRTDPKWGRVKETTNLNHGPVSQGNADMVWGSGHNSIQQQASKTAAISTGNMGGWGSQPRYSGEHRYSSGQRDHYRNHSQSRDSGFGRDRSSWNSRQPTHGSGSGSYKPSGKGQRVCKFYENGYCKKGASCSYLHP